MRTSLNCIGWFLRTYRLAVVVALGIWNATLGGSPKVIEASTADLRPPNCT